MTIELAPEVRARLDAHLDGVERSLITAGRSREQRRAIVDDLETQILDMLAKRSSSPVVTDMNEVLAGLDPPDAYSDAIASPAAPGTFSPTPLPQRPRYSRTAMAGFICILVSLIPAALVLIFAIYMAAAYHPPAPGMTVPINEFTRDPATGELRQGVIRMAPGSAVTTKRVGIDLVCILFLLGPLALAGTILGWIAFAQVRNSAGMIRGTGLALFDGLFYPVLTALLMIVGVVRGFDR